MSNSFIDRLNTISESWATWMGSALIETAVVAAVIGLIWLALRKRTSPQLGYLLFLLIPLRLLIPLEIHVPGIPAVWSSPQSEPAGSGSVMASTAAYHSGEPVLHRVNETSASSTVTSVTTIGKSDSVATSSLSSSSWLMVAWGAVVLFLFARLILAQIRFARLVRRARELDLSDNSIVMQTMCQRIGVGTVLESDEIDSPAVCGLFRPKIVLPTGILKSLSVKQREWILFHELAHVRRRDLLVNCVQRLVAILHFPNPAMWLANAQINRLREYACDDLASTLSAASQVESSEAFLTVVKHATLRRREPLFSCALALGMSHSRSQRACYRRMTRLLDSDVARSVKLGWRSVLVLLLAAVVALPQLRAAEQTSNEKQDASKQPTQSNPTPKTDAPAADSKPTVQSAVHFSVIVAKHVLLLDGKEIITWEGLQRKIASSPDPSLVYPHFYITRGATEAGLYEQAKEKIWNLHKDFKFNGHSEGSLWPRTDFRYDRIETADDLKPDPALLKTGTVSTNGKPVAGAEVVLITPVDESIGYRSYHLALVDGRIRNRMEHVMTITDEIGKYSLYPPKDTPYYILAIHPEAGFAMFDHEQDATDTKIPLLAWGGIVTKLEDPKNEQHADLSTTIESYDGKPEVVINQYWSDLNQKEKTREFRFLQVPPFRNTSISRSFPSPDGGSTSLSAATVNLLPGETRSIDFGEISQAQLDWLQEIRSGFPSPSPPKKQD